MARGGTPPGHGDMYVTSRKRRCVSLYSQRHQPLPYQSTSAFFPSCCAAFPFPHLHHNSSSFFPPPTFYYISISYISACCSSFLPLFFLRCLSYITPCQRSSPLCYVAFPFLLLHLSSSLFLSSFTLNFISFPTYITIRISSILHCLSRLLSSFMFY